MTIVDYRILWAGTATALAGLVSAALADGWQPNGGVAVALNGHPDYGQVIYAQSMVRYGTPVNQP